MRIGIPKEIKIDEHRVAALPEGVSALVQQGHEVYVEHDAGSGVFLSDHAYRKAGATICPNKKQLYGLSELIVKVKEPIGEELALLREGHILFAFLHLAAEPALLKTLMERKVTAVAFETVQEDSGLLPILTPMSEIAGRMAPQVGAWCLEKSMGGRGVLLGGVPGVSPALVGIVGGGMVGTNAARIALGLGASVVIIDVNMERLRFLDYLFQGRVQTLLSTPDSLEECLGLAVVVVGAALIPGARTPHIITEEMIMGMQPGAVFVDVSIDQGGCAATSRPTSHREPTFVVYDVVHYCVANMPSGVAQTATVALANVTLPYILDLATHGLDATLERNPAFARGLNVRDGAVVHEKVKMAADVWQF